jgi:hypothetical protein
MNDRKSIIRQHNRTSGIQIVDNDHRTDTGATELDVMVILIVIALMFVGGCSLVMLFL